MDYVIVEQETWPDQLAQLVIESVGSVDGPIMLYAEDDVGLSMGTSVIFEQGGQLKSLGFDKLDEIAYVMQELYMKWGGAAGNVRGVLFVIRGNEFSARFTYADMIDPEKTMHDRSLAHVNEVFGREWVPPAQ
jgi:hypothetical protein